MPIQYYDNTRVSTARECLRKYYLRHELDWVRTGLAKPLVFGLSWHEAMDVVWGLAQTDASDKEIVQAAMAAFLKTWTNDGAPAWEDMTPDVEAMWSPRTPGVAAEMLHNYIKLRRPMIRQYEILGIEQPFAVPLDPDNPDLFYIGRLDKVFRNERGQIIVGEHKTTTSYKKGGPFRADYLTSWSPNSQIDGYLHAAHMLYGEKAHSVWIDAALVHKQVHDGFKFIPVNRHTSHIKSWLYETRFWIDIIEGEKANLGSIGNSEYLAAWPKNTNSCSNWAGCSYRDVCSTFANPAIEELPAGFKKEHWEPFDILNIEKLGLAKPSDYVGDSGE